MTDTAKKAAPRTKAPPEKKAAKATKAEPAAKKAKAAEGVAPKTKPQAGIPAAKPAQTVSVGAQPLVASDTSIVVTRKQAKPVVAPVGSKVRVELPENDRQPMTWQLQKLPHGVVLSDSTTEPAAKTAGHLLVTHHRIFNFVVEAAGDFALQFNLNRGFGVAGFADTFRMKLKGIP